jgi:hypothetical protein
MTRSQAPKGMDLATWLRLRAERRGQAGIVAGYVHELSDRHGRDDSADEGPGASDDGHAPRAEESA